MRMDEWTTGALFSELMHGVSRTGGFMLNVGDHGLLRSLERVSAAEASALTRTGSSIAAHVDHLRYGLSLMNRWSQGENPFGSADWRASWRKRPSRAGALEEDLRAASAKRRAGSWSCARRARSKGSS